MTYFDNPKPGHKVEFDKCYALKACNRHEFIYDDKYHLVNTTLVPLRIGLERGFIVGIRWCLMEDYKIKYHGEDGGPPTAYGKPEKVLLVIKKITQKPFIVRFKDAISL